MNIDQERAAFGGMTYAARAVQPDCEHGREARAWVAGYAQPTTKGS